MPKPAHLSCCTHYLFIPLLFAAPLLQAKSTDGYLSTQPQGCQIYLPSPQPPISATWEGACNPQGFAEGGGVLRLKDANGDPVTHRGYWQQGKQQGLGSQESHLFQYAGAFRDSLPHGIGTIDTPYTHYAGEIHNGNMHGSGSLLIMHKQYLYQGQWQKNELNGWGEMVSHKPNDTFRYQGAVCQNQKHGFGTIIFHPNSKSFYKLNAKQRQQAILQNGEQVLRGWFEHNQFVAACASAEDCAKRGYTAKPCAEN